MANNRVVMPMIRFPDDVPSVVSTPGVSSSSTSSSTAAAISVANLHLSYDKTRVLNGVNLQASRGTIFGLLGPSGCGKTSLIRCILGTLAPSAGVVTVLGVRPRSPGSTVPGAGVGYMPQDICLYEDLTISETLEYFAALLGMDERQTEERREFLLGFLQLPESSRRIRALSGGQKRRVSLAAALIHKPPILILDEPTVGVDPLLRQSIWAHLTQLSTQDGLTVLITTHYIEEAKDANQIGLLRDGRMLAQDSPQALRSRYDKPNLEAVFLHLCAEAEAKAKQDVESGDSDKLVVTFNAKDAAVDQPPQLPPRTRVSSTASSSSSSTSSGISSLASESHSRPQTPLAKAPADISTLDLMSAMVRKNIYSIRRNVVLMLFQFMLPTLEVILFCACIGLNLHSIPVAVYNGDGSEFSHRILNALNTDILKVSNFPSTSAAIDAVRSGSASTAITMLPNFSTCLYQRMISMGSELPPDVLDNSTIHLHPDMSNQLMVYAVQKEVTRVYLQESRNFLEENGASAALLELPVKMEAPVYGLQEPIYRDYMAPGTILSIAFLSAIPLTAMVLVVERKQGLVERSMVCGASYAKIMIALLIPQMAILFVSSLALMIFVFPIFGIPYHGEFFLIFLLTYLQALAGMCFGVLVSTLAKDENTATMMALGFFYPNLLLSGTVWPVEAMSPWVQTFASYLPQTMPISTMRLIITRGWSLFHLQVVCGFAVTLLWISAFLSFSVIAFKSRRL